MGAFEEKYAQEGFPKLLAAKSLLIFPNKKLHNEWKILTQKMHGYTVKYVIIVLSAISLKI
jgi:hypothetical protein